MVNMEIPRGQKPEPQANVSNRPEQTNPPKSKHGLGLLFGSILVILLIVLAGLWFKSRPAQKAGSVAQGGRGAGGPVPVVAGTVVQKDVPLYLDGLGTVQAFNTITI